MYTGIILEDVIFQLYTLKYTYDNREHIRFMNVKTHLSPTIIHVNESSGIRISLNITYNGL